MYQLVEPRLASRRYRGGEDFGTIGAETHLGEIDFALNEAVSDPSIYSEFLERRDYGLHHIACMAGLEGLEAVRRRFDDEGIGVAMAGRIDETIEFMYFDTEPALGVAIESGRADMRSASSLTAGLRRRREPTLRPSSGRSRLSSTTSRARSAPSGRILAGARGMFRPRFWGMRDAEVEERADRAQNRPSRVGRLTVGPCSRLGAQVPRWNSRPSYPGPGRSTSCASSVAMNASGCVTSSALIT